MRKRRISHCHTGCMGRPSPAAPQAGLEVERRRGLEITVIVYRTCNLTRLRRTDRRIGVREVRRVEGVERVELQVQALVFVQLEAPLQTDVPILRSRAIQHRTRHVAIGVGSGCLKSAHRTAGQRSLPGRTQRGVKETKRIAMVDLAPAADPVWPARRAAIHTTVESHGKRRAGSVGSDGVNFEATQNFGSKTAVEELLAGSER